MKRIIFFLLLAFLAITSNSQGTKKEISLTDVWASATFWPEGLGDVVSLEDGEHYCLLEDGAINKYSYSTGEKVSAIVSESQLVNDKGSPISIDEYVVSPDESKVLIGTDIEYIYRYSTKMDYYLWDVKTSRLSKLSEGGKQRLASFSPDGKSVAFLRDNNIFIKDLASAKETQLTTDGKFNYIIYGSPDWVYEEEFSMTTAYHWSPDGRKLAYYRFDESNVKEYDITLYDSLYPTTYKYKYPKAGEDNSIIKIYTYDLNTGKSVMMDIGAETDQYIPRVNWAGNSNQLIIQRMNRLQNKLEYLLTDASSGTSKAILTRNDDKYIEITNDLYFLKDGKGFIITSDQSGFNHIYVYDMSGKEIRQLTSGNWCVWEILGFDDVSNIIYYSSSENSVTDRDLYCIKTDGSGKKQLGETGSSDVTLSKGCRYYFNSWSNANTPPRVALYKASGKEIKLINDNASVKDAMKEYGFTKKEIFTITTSEKVDLNAWMIKPPDFSKDKKYPVILYVYGGPGAQTVNNSWGGPVDIVWAEMMAQKGYIVLSVDNRGTPGRGASFTKSTYGQLGKLETMDQIEVAKYLGTLSYVDKSRIGIWGWSFGGYLTTLCMTKGAEYFKTGVAVAPVTNWRYYDNIYTERYMGLPKDNPDGYDDNSPVNFVKKLKGKFLVVHGTADDNVHLQNSMMLVDALVNANKQFEMQFYPNKNHGIYGGYTRLHLFQRITDFFLNNL